MAGARARLTLYQLPARELVSYDWEQKASQAFGMRRTQVLGTMAELEWVAYQKKMCIMPPEERQQYQQGGAQP